MKSNLQQVIVIDGEMASGKTWLANYIRSGLVLEKSNDGVFVLDLSAEVTDQELRHYRKHIRNWHNPHVLIITGEDITRRHVYRLLRRKVKTMFVSVRLENPMVYP